MTWFTRSSRFTILALALTLGAAFNVSAQTPRPSSSSLGRLLQNSFKPPTGRGIAINRQGGATRNPETCFMDSRATLTALVPTVAGETSAEYPTVFWYMPKMSAEKAPAPILEFTLRDANNEQKIYSAEYPLTKSANGLVGTPGIMSLRLARPLEVGKEYKWQLRAKCDASSRDNSEDPSVEGVIKRVVENPELESRVQQASAEERVMLYAEANRWYEMLANLVALRRDRPNDPTVTDAWNQLFAAVELDKVTIQSSSQGVRNTTN